MTGAPAGTDPTGVVDRPRFDALRDALLGEPGAGRSAVLLAAPPGFGKTTLARAWAVHSARTGRPVAWHEVTPATAGARHLWRALLRDLRGAGPPVEEALAGLAPPDRAGDADVVLDLLDRLAGTPLLLVVDGLHLVRDASVLDDLDHLVRRLPSSARVLLVSRTTPPMPVVLDHRLDGCLVVVRARDLAFTADEAATVCPWLDAPELEAVLGITEGWPALTRLVANAVRDGADASAVWDREQPLVDAVFGETLRRLPDDEREILMAAAVTDPAPLDLVVELADRADAGRVLDRSSAETGLVLASRSTDGDAVYHLHASLAGYLRAERVRVDPRQARDDHGRAARWFLGRDEALDAVRHAVLSRDGDLVEQVLARTGPGLVTDGRSESLLAVLEEARRLPSGPWARVVRALALVDAGRVGEVDPEVPGQVAVGARDGPGLAALRRVLEWQVGRLRGERPDLGRVEPVDAARLDPDVGMLLHLSRGALFLRAGEWTLAEDDLTRAVALATAHDRPGTRLDAVSLLGALAASHADVDGLRAAVSEAGTVARDHEWLGSARSAHLHGLAGMLAHVELDPALAWSHADRAAALVGTRDDPSVQVGVESLAAVTLAAPPDPARGSEALHHVWRERRGCHLGPDVVAYLAVADAIGALVGRRPERFVEIDQEVATRLGDVGEARFARAVREVAHGRRRAASVCLHEVVEERPPSVVPVTPVYAALLVARLHAEEEDHGPALHAVRAVLDRCAELGVRRPLVDLGGPAVVAVLRAGVGGWGIHEALVAEVLSLSSAPGRPAPSLTARECDVLHELATLRTVEEIAQVLVVSVNTVKSHVRGVYRKLGVATRRDAIAEARRTGLL